METNLRLFKGSLESIFVSGKLTYLLATTKKKLQQLKARVKRVEET